MTAGATPTGTAASDPRGDYLSILSGTSQNVVGIVIAALATFAAQIVLSRSLGAAGFGSVTVVTQAAFVLSFATRAGMDMAVLRDVAIEIGIGRRERVKVPVQRAVLIAGLVSLVVAIGALLAADRIAALFSLEGQRNHLLVQAGAVGLPFIAVTNVWLSATRGLKIMRYTLYVFWAGQPVMWVLLMLGGLSLVRAAWMGALAYSVSWMWASVAAWFFWHKESRQWPASPMEPGWLPRLTRYAGPRAPAALFSQLLFWTDLFVLTHFASDTEVGLYSAALRAGQVMVLFLTSVSLMFSPFVADLHNRGETDRLNNLFKALTRWTLAGTIPVFLVLAVAPQDVLRIFGSEFAGGQTAMLILLAGQFINVATGSVGFILIMVGRTGWDLVVYAASLVLDLGLAFWLCPKYGMEGAAVANAVTFVLSNWTRLALVWRFVHIEPYDRNYLRLLPPTLAALLAMIVVHASWSAPWVLRLTATVAVGLVVYAAAYLTLGLTESERRGLSRVRTRLAGGRS